MLDNLSVNFDKINSLIVKLHNETNKRLMLDDGLAIANEFMHILGVPYDDLNEGDDALDLALPNSKFKNQKMEIWFEKHPYMGSGRVALYHYQGKLPIESMFYQLSDSPRKEKISATTQLFPNWEDNELTMIPSYKVGIDFFLSTKTKALLVVISKKSNLRVMELSERLTNTQKEILDKIKNIALYDGIDPKTHQKIQFEPQRTIHTTLWNALELKEVNKKFYIGIADHFAQLCQYLNHNTPNGLSTSEITESSKIFASRLIGRILFVWFLKKKGIINEKEKYFGVTNLSSTDYYEKKLKILFFETLNNPIAERKTTDKLTPYLNGGLFEAHSNDWPNLIVQFPEGWFETLYAHLNMFNFTTDESSSDYEQVAIDPEMLGRVFENLLASLIPDTAKAANERNNKGAFYTPREIVDFMCKSSLKKYLIQNATSEKDNDGIEMLIETSDADFLMRKSTGMMELWGVRTQKVREKLIEALNNLKVLDPACGSGAFPIGMLQLILKTYDRLGSYYDTSLQKMRCISFSEHNNIYLTKLYIIRNNLYGSDIEPMAIEIARLRAWLSLIIDDKKDVDPLPNLDFNFVCANSLVPLKKQVQLSFSDDYSFENNFDTLRNIFFNEHDHSRKKELKVKFEALFNDSLSNDTTYNASLLKTWNPFDNSKPAGFFDSKKMFNIEKFDIVIGNPPYIHFEDYKELSKFYSKLNYKTYKPRGDMYALFYEMAINNLKKNGILCFITSNKWMKSSYGENLRNLFVERTNPKLLIDLGPGVFDSATVDTNILLLENEHVLRTDILALTLLKEYKEKTLLDSISQYGQSKCFKYGQTWTILADVGESINEKIDKYGVELRNWEMFDSNRGIITGLNEAFIIDSNTRNSILSNCKNQIEKNKTEALIVPILRGKDISEYKYKFEDNYVILAYFGINKTIEKEYPSIYEWLKKFEIQLKERGQCKTTSSGKINKPSDLNYPGYPGTHHWLELDNCPNKEYLDNISMKKVVYREISDKMNACIVPENIYINNKAYFIVSKYPEFILGVLNSNLFNKVIAQQTNNTGGKGPKFISKCKIPLPTSEQNEKMINLIDRINSKKIENCDLEIKEINELVYEIYHLSYEEIQWLNN